MATKKKKSEPIKCSICGRKKAKNSVNFYKSNLQEYAMYDGYCSTCKDCLQKSIVDVNTNTVTIDSIKNTLQKLNKPLVDDLFIEVSNLGIENKKILGEYIKRLNTYCSGKYKDKQFSDSIDIKIESDNRLREKQIQRETREVTDDMILFWGRNKDLSEQDYLDLQAKFDGYVKYEDSMDKKKENDYRRLCVLELQSSKIEYDIDKVKSLVDYQKMINELSTSLGIQAIQKRDEMGNERFTLGLVTRYIEDVKKRPIPRYVEDLGGEDKIHEYMNEYLGGICQSFNLKNPKQSEYDEMMKSYVITKKDIEDYVGTQGVEEDE